MTERPKTVKTKQQILLAALDCYTKYGYANASVERIRDAAGVSVGSIYHHFGNKEGIFAALFIEGMREHHHALQTSLEKSKTAKQAVETLISCFADWVVKNPDWARFVFYERRTIMNTEHQSKIVADNQQHFGAIRRMLAKHIESGAIKKMPPDLFNALIIGPTMLIARQWLAGGTKTHLTDSVKPLAEAAWQSVSSESKME